MEIRGTNSLSFQMAKAYGVNAARQPASIKNIAEPFRPQHPDSFEASSSAKTLVAARVSQPVNFEAAAADVSRSGPAATHVLQMYTRAADRIEAAVAVQIGRSIDLRG